MSDKPRPTSKYVKVIDISERARAAERAREAMESLESSADRLPPCEIGDLLAA